MLNLRSNIFQKFLVYTAMWTLDCFAVGVWAPTFFRHTKFEVKNFLEFFNVDRGLWTLDFSQGLNSGYQLFLVTLNLRSKNLRKFFIYRALWTLEFFVQRDVRAPNFFWSR